MTLIIALFLIYQSPLYNNNNQTKNIMNLQNIESIANEACFSTDPNIKFQAENLFVEFLTALDIQHYANIMEGFSQTVLFVFLSFLDKKVSKSQDIMRIFYILSQKGKQWIQPNGQFKRPMQQQPMKSYVSNTLGMVLGRCMKHIYIKQDLRKQLTQYLQNEQTPKLLKLFLYKHMIEIVSTIDTQMQYVQYRTLIYSFQEKMVPMILNEMYPYFLAIADMMKFNQLSSMIPGLKVGEGSGNIDGQSQQQQEMNIVNNILINFNGTTSQTTTKFQLFLQSQRIITNLVFSLLSQIVNFKYNITFSEYDLQTEFENIMVSFPQSVITHLTSKQFLEAFYFMLQKMCLNVQYSGPNLDCTFQCLKKILLSKVTYFNKDQRLNLISMHYYGLMRILMSANPTEEKLINHIFQSLFKFIHAFEFTDLQKAHINHLQLLQLIKQKSIIVISTTPLTNDNTLYQSTTSLVFKIAGQAIAMSQQKYMQFYYQLCKQFYVVFLQNFLLKGENICGKVEMSKISTFKSTLQEYFFNINRIASMDMKFLFQLLLSKSQQVFSSNNEQIISNFLFLVTDICEENFYDRSLIYDATTDEDLVILGEIIHKCFQFINFYKKSASESLISSRSIELAIILFFEKILTECLDNVSANQESIMMMSKTYKVINSYKVIPLNNEDFLLYFFKELMLTLKTQNAENIEYILQVLYSLLLKLKWSLKRETFIQSHICKQILNEMIDLSCFSLQSSFQLIKLRRKLFKIITTLSFDDILDTYRTNINNVIESIVNHFRQKNYNIIVFDMSGICDNIDTPVIYRYFLNRVDEKIGIKTLLKTLYENYNNDLNVLEQIISLNRSLLTDKALRMGNRQLSILLYEIIDYSLPFITIILKQCNGQLWSDIMKQTYHLSNIILDSTYVNLFLIKRKSESKLNQFLYTLMENILLIHSWAVHYPQLARHFYQTMKIFLNNCAEVILVLEQSQFMVVKFVDLLKCVMYYVLKNLQNLSQGAKDYHLCEKLLQSIGKFYSFLRYKCNFVHRKTLIENIQHLITTNTQYSIEFLQSLYRLAMSNLKNLATILNCICICIMELSYFYPTAYHQIFKSLGISQDKIKKFQKLYSRVINNQQDPLFVINLKEWLAISDTKDLEDIDY